MHNRKNNKQVTQQDVFNLVIQAAKAKDIQALKKIIAITGYGNLDDDSFFNDKVYELLAAPAMKLAETCDVEAVNFLTNIRSGLKNEAIEAYARCNHAAQVDELINQGASLNRAVFGYACKGLDTRVKDLLARGGKIESAISGYARGGFDTLVNDLLHDHPNNISLAVYGYACGGHFKQMEELLAHDGNKFDAIRGFLNTNYFTSKSRFLYLLTMLENKSLRVELINTANKRYPRYFSTKNMLAESDRIKRVMSQQQLSYNQAIAWLTVKFRFWLLQGIKCIEATRLPLEIVLHIAAMIPSCAPLTLTEILDIRPKLMFHANKLFVIKNLNCYSLGMFPGTNKRKKRAEALVTICKDVKSKHTLLTLIKYQQDLFAKKIQVTPNRHRPVHEQPFENYEADQFTAIIDRYFLKLSK